MPPRSSSRSTKKPLIGAALALLLLVVFLIVLIGSDHGQLACSAVAPAQAATLEEPLATPAVLDPPTKVAAVHDEPVVRNATNAAGRVDGFVIDAVTREAVPWIDVHLRGGSVSSDVVTDASGSFHCDVAFPVGKLTAKLIDDGVDVGTVEIDHSAAGTHGWMIVADIGPTYLFSRIDGKFPKNEDWLVRLVETTMPDDCSGVLGVTADGLAMVQPDGEHPDREWPWIHMRPGEPPFARYPKPLFPPDALRRAFVEVKSPTLYALGREHVDRTVGIHIALQLETKPFAVVSGQIAPTGEALKSPVFVYLGSHSDLSTDGRDRSVPRWEEAQIETNGKFSFETTLRNDCSLVAVCPNGISDVVTVIIKRPGPVSPTNAVRMRTPQPPDVADLKNPSAPTARARPRKDGRKNARLAQSYAWVRLRPSSGGNWMRAWLLDSADESLLVDDVPDARYDSAVIGRQQRALFGTERVSTFLKNWDPNTKSGGRLRQQSILSVDDATSMPLRRSAVTFGPNGGLVDMNSLTTDSVWQAAERAPISFAVWRPGYQPAFGDEKAFSQVNGSEEFVATVRMTPGWGAQISVRVGDPKARGDASWPWPDDDREWVRPLVGAVAGPPLPQVELRADRTPIATSDANGDLRVATRVIPVQLTLHAEGWKLVALDRLSGSQCYVAWMKRAP